MAVKKGAYVFGFEELEKAFTRVKKRYPDNADALLRAYGQMIRKKTRSLTPVHQGDYSQYKDRNNGELKKSWRVLPPKTYKNGTVRVMKIKSKDPVAHLIEDGHKMFTTRRTRGADGRLQNEAVRESRIERWNNVQRAARGIKSKGYVEGKHMLEESIVEARKKFTHDAQGMLDRLTKDIQV